MIFKSSLDPYPLTWYDVIMKELVELDRFKEKVTRGRFSGQETEFAIIIGGDNYSWNISRKNLNASTPPIGQKYCKGFCDLLSYLKDFKINSDKAVEKIVNALEKNTGIDSNDLKHKISQTNSLRRIGELIDDHFKCNYNRLAHDSGKMSDPDRIYVRVLKANIKTTKKVEE